MKISLPLVSLVLASLSLSCAAPSGSNARGLALAPTATAAAPAVWHKVRLVVVDVAEGPTEAFSVPPSEALGRALVARLGSGGDRPVTLEVNQVRVATRNTPHAELIGLAADFRLKTEDGEKTVRLEQSVDIMHGARGDAENAYALLVDDLCDRLFYDADALRFLGELGATPAEDAALAAGMRNLGPVVGTAASSSETQASGRIAWGEREIANNGVVSFLFGDTKMLMAAFESRDTNLRYGIGQRVGGGLVVMPGTTSSTVVLGQTIDTSTPTYLGFTFDVGLDVGYSATVRSPEGYVLYPGWSLVVVPQGRGFMMFGNQNDQRITLQMVTVGAAVELDVPIGASFGFKGTLFAGATAASVTAGDSTFKTGFQRVTNPSIDFYTQSSTGRVSLGLGLSSLAMAATDSASREALTRNPMLVFTWEDWVGRGMAYAKQDVSVFGESVDSSAEVLSTPRSAFVDESTVGAAVATPTPEPKAPAPFRPDAPAAPAN